MPLPKNFSQGTEYTDLRGNVIVPGNTIVYAALSGRSCQLCEATVLDIAVKDRVVHHREGHREWDGVSYEPPSRWDPNAPSRKLETYVVDREWDEIVQDYKVQLQPTGRYGRWNQHSKPQVYDSILGKYVETGEPIKSRWVMAEQACKVG